MIRVDVHVKPGSSRDEVEIGADGAIGVRLRARAVEGHANESLVEVLADRLGLRRRQVTLVRGARSRTKLVEIEIDSIADVRTRLGTIR